MPLFQPAVKSKLKARVAIDGPTGSGKTWTALQWARILAGPDGKIGLVDTENRSAAYYAPAPGELIERVNWWDPPYEFGHLAAGPPYDPRVLRTLIAAAAEELGDDGVLVIDSLTHFWNGEGGTLDVVDDAASRGNSFTGWKEGTPAQRGMLDAIIHSPCHVIVTMRSKMEYILVETTKNGKKYTEPTKVGMAPEQRSGVEYEFTVVADMDLEHRLVVSKSRCSLIADAVAPHGRSVEVAQRFAGWLDTGAAMLEADDLADIVARFRLIPDEPTRAEMKRLFNAEFGLTSDLTDDRLPAVKAWLDLTLAPFVGSSPPPEAADSPESVTEAPIPPDSEQPEYGDVCPFCQQLVPVAELDAHIGLGDGCPADREPAGPDYNEPPGDSYVDPAAAEPPAKETKLQRAGREAAERAAAAEAARHDTEAAAALADQETAG